MRHSVKIYVCIASRRIVMVVGLSPFHFVEGRVYIEELVQLTSPCMFTI